MFFFVLADKMHGAYLKFDLLNRPRLIFKSVQLLRSDSMDLHKCLRAITGKLHTFVCSLPFDIQVAGETYTPRSACICEPFPSSLM